MQLFDTYKQLLTSFVSFKSISTDPQFSSEISATTTFLHDLFLAHGFTVQLLTAKQCNPVVFAEYRVATDKPTVLVYGHYDVQPAEGWDHNPFLVREIDNRLLARGVVDNKGQILIHIATVLALIEENHLSYNVKFLIEGNEETANPEMTTLVREHKDLLRCDHILISDGELIGDHPVQEISLRGGANVTLTYKTAQNDLHSGIYGSAAPNAAHELAHFLDSLYQDRIIAIPGWYDTVDTISTSQRENNRSLPFSMEDLSRSTGMQSLLTESDTDFYSQTGLRPSIQVTGIKSGYIGDGYANIVPASAEARINFRFVASQDPEEMLQVFEEYVRAQTPEYVTWNISRTDSYKPVAIDVSTSFMQHIKSLLEDVYGKQVLYKNVGGSIPVVVDFKEHLGVDACLVPFGNEDCNMHGKDENFKIELILKALAFSSRFFGT